LNFFKAWISQLLLKVGCLTKMFNHIMSSNVRLLSAVIGHCWKVIQEKSHTQNDKYLGAFHYAKPTGQRSVGIP